MSFPHLSIITTAYCPPPPHRCRSEKSRAGFEPVSREERFLLIDISRPIWARLLLVSVVIFILPSIISSSWGLEFYGENYFENKLPLNERAYRLSCGVLEKAFKLRLQIDRFYQIEITRYVLNSMFNFRLYFNHWIINGTSAKNRRARFCDSPRRI